MPVPRRPQAATALALLLASGGLAACGSSSSGSSEPQPAKVENVRGQRRIVLSRQASERIGLRTVPIAPAGGGARRLTFVPYSALMYEPDGSAFVYERSAPLAFVRRPVGVDHIAGNDAFLSSGPPAGTSVVTVGADELHGVEIGVAEE